MKPALASICQFCENVSAAQLERTRTTRSGRRSCSGRPAISSSSNIISMRSRTVLFAVDFQCRLLIEDHGFRGSGRALDSGNQVVSKTALAIC